MTRLLVPHVATSYTTLGNYLGFLNLGSLPIKLGRITLTSQGCFENLKNVYIVLGLVLIKVLNK